MKIVTRSVSEGLPYYRSSEESSVRRNFGKVLRCAQNDESDALPMNSGNEGRDGLAPAENAPPRSAHVNVKDGLRIEGKVY